MRLCKRLLSVLSAVLIMTAFFTLCASAADDIDEKLITDCAKYISTGNYEKWAELFAPCDKEEYRSFIESHDNKANYVGIFAVENARVEQIKGVNLSIARRFTDIDAYTSKYGSVSAHFAKINCTLCAESNFHKNGDNYRLYIIARDNGDSFIAEESTILFDDWCEDVSSAQGTDTPIAAQAKEPTDILVYRTSTGTVENVGFRYYQAVVAECEFGYASVSNDAYHKSGVMALKMYAWFRTLRAKYPGLGYNVKDSTNDQLYNPTRFNDDLAAVYQNKWYRLVDSLKGSYLLNSDGNFFQTGYVANSTYNSHAVQGGGIMSQNEAYLLGKNDGYTYEEILHFFYDNSALDYVSPNGKVQLCHIEIPLELTATFLADGRVVSKVTFTANALSIAEPPVPEKAGYSGRWEAYTLAAQSLTINAVYVPITYFAVFTADAVSISVPYTVLTNAISEPPVPYKSGYIGAWESYTLTIGGVNVNAVYTPVSDISLSISAKAATIKYRDTMKLVAVVSPNDAPIGKIVWSSGNLKVATVDADTGVVTAVSNGSATITATLSSDVTVSDSCQVTVKTTWWQWLIKVLLFGWIWY